MTANVKCIDAALPLLFPNPSLGINLTMLGLALAGGHAFFSGRPEFAVWFAVLAVLQVAMFLVGVLLMLWLLRRTGAPASVSRQARVLLAVVVAQAVVGERVHDLLWR